MAKKDRDRDERTKRRGGSSPFEPLPPAEKAEVAANRVREAPEDFAERRGASPPPPDKRASGRIERAGASGRETTRPRRRG